MNIKELFSFKTANTIFTKEAVTFTTCVSATVFAGAAMLFSILVCAPIILVTVTLSSIVVRIFKLLYYVYKSIGGN